MKFGSGNIVRLKKGEKIEMAESKRPNSGFAEFMDSIASQIGATLEISKDLLIKKYDRSYSAARAALMEVWKAFRMRRLWLVSDFCRPVYEVWLSEAVAIGRIKAPGFFDDPLGRKAYLESIWIGPAVV